jgi:uncharacterized protein (TIGR02246 family)
MSDVSLAEAIRDKAALAGLFDRLIEGWNREDADAFAAVFTDDAIFVAFDGTTLLGRRQIAAFHKPLFKTHLKGMRLSARIGEIRPLTSDACAVLMMGATTLPGKDEPSSSRDSVQTLTAVRQDGQWAFATFQNTRLRPIRPGMSFLAWSLADAAWRLLGGRSNERLGALAPQAAARMEKSSGTRPTDRRPVRAASHELWSEAHATTGLEPSRRRPT